MITFILGILTVLVGVAVMIAPSLLAVPNRLTLRFGIVLFCCIVAGAAIVIFGVAVAGAK